MRIFSLILVNIWIVVLNPNFILHLYRFPNEHSTSSLLWLSTGNNQQVKQRMN